MRFHALACDYDGTIALSGRVDAETVAALHRLRAGGRKLLLVTGRELEELLGVFPETGLFDRVVAENGALLYTPSSGDKKHFGEPPTDAFIDALRIRGVQPIAVGQVIVATWHPHETAVLDAIQSLGLEMQVIFNKGAVMVLPANVNKASGLKAALADLGLTPHEVVGIGDAENDHAFLNLCECSVAVENALPSVKERVDIVMAEDHGAGVVTLIDQMIGDDLAKWEEKLLRHLLLLGHQKKDGAEVRIPPYGVNVLVAGPKGNGLESPCMALTQQIVEAKYQVCAINAEAECEDIPNVVTLGSSQAVPQIEEIAQVLKDPSSSLNVNLAGTARAERAQLFAQLLVQIQSMRAENSRPHWLVVNEAHELLPVDSQETIQWMARESKRVVFATTQPRRLARFVLESTDLVLTTGPEAAELLANIAGAVGAQIAYQDDLLLGEDETLAWPRFSNHEPFVVKRMLKTSA